MIFFDLVCLCNYGGASGSIIFIGPTFSRGTNFFKKIDPGTEIFSEKIGPGTKIFRNKIPVTVLFNRAHTDEMALYNLNEVLMHL